MPKYIIKNKEVFMVSYVVDGVESPEQAQEKFLTEDFDGKSLDDIEYICDLNAYTQIYEPPLVVEIL